LKSSANNDTDTSKSLNISASFIYSRNKVGLANSTYNWNNWWNWTTYTYRLEKASIQVKKISTNSI